MIAVLATVKGPHIDWAALSPIVALLGGSVLVLLAGLLRSRFMREQLVPFLALATFGATIGLAIWQWDTNTLVVAGALRIDNLTLLSTLLVCATGIAATLIAWRGQAARDLAHGEFFALMLVSSAGMVVLVAAHEPRHDVHGPRAAVAAALRPVRRDDAQRALARVRPEVPDHRLGRLGDAALRLRADLRRDRPDGLRGDRAGDRHPPRRGRRPVPHGGRDDGRRAGLQGVARAVPPVDAGRLRGRPDVGHGVHVGRHEDGGVRRDPAALRHRAAAGSRRLAPGLDHDRAAVDPDRQRRRARPGLDEAHARLLVDRAGRLHPRRRRRRDEPRRAGGPLLPGRVPVREPRGVRRDRGARARDGPRRRPRRAARPRRPAPGARGEHDARDAEPRRHSRDGGLHRQVPADRGGHGRRVHVAGHPDRDRVDDLAGVLPAGRRGDVARRGRARARARRAHRPARARRRQPGGRPAQRPAGRSSSWRSCWAPPCSSSASSRSRCFDLVQSAARGLGL